MRSEAGIDALVVRRRWSNGQTPKTDRKRGKPYSAEEIARLRELVAQGLSRKRIAEAMGRPLGSIDGIVGLHGIKTLGGKGGRPRRLQLQE